MKVMTVLGTRPEIIRLSLVIPLLDKAVEHVLVHTGQNFDDGLDGVFFRDLGVRQPDANLGAKGGFGIQVGAILSGVERLLLEHRPDRLLVLGDTNSGLSAIVARRLGVAVYHMEAGNRCFDDRVPEEVNRRIIDHCSTVLMPYTNRSRENLLREGIPGDRIYTTGNPIKQVIDRFAPQIAGSEILSRLLLTRGKFFLVTMHRAENVDNQARLTDLVDALVKLHAQYGYPVVCSIHPRTSSKIEQFGLGKQNNGLQLLTPMGFFDFVHLEQNAFCCISDSGTVQEEACIFGVPNVTIREVTERPETVECGSNFLAGTDPDAILRAVALVTANAPSWQPPIEYLAPAVAETTCRIVTGFRLPDRAELEWAVAARG
ncbi:MAG: non-hydrolyzing UDP-N-acetylglucosamine 2-epimerase [Gemmatimonadaceae bacterium]